MATHSSVLTWEFHGQRSLESYSPLGHKESDMTEWLTHTHTHTSSRFNNVQHFPNSFDHRNPEYRPSHRTRSLMNVLWQKRCVVRLKGDVQDPE